MDFLLVVPHLLFSIIRARLELLCSLGNSQRVLFVGLTRNLNSYLMSLVVVGRLTTQKPGERGASRKRCRSQVNRPSPIPRNRTLFVNPNFNMTFIHGIPVRLVARLEEDRKKTSTASASSLSRCCICAVIPQPPAPKVPWPQQQPPPRDSAARQWRTIPTLC